MARIRSIHAEQWTDDAFVTCSPLARLLAIGIRNQADDNGIFEWNPIKLKMRILPGDNCDPASLLEELLQTDQVIKFNHGGKQYGMVRSFQKFQKPKKPAFYHPTPTEPLPYGYALSVAYLPACSEQLPNKFRKLSADGEGEGKGIEVGKKAEEDVDGSPASAPPPPIPIQSKKPPPSCPHQKLIELYHEVLPTCPKVRVSRWSGSANEKNLQARWREGLEGKDGWFRYATEEEGLAKWRELFEVIADSDFLMGRVPGSNGRAPFMLDLPWLVVRGNFDKVMSNKYSSNESAA